MKFLCSSCCHKHWSTYSDENYWSIVNNYCIYWYLWISLIS